ncbi:guanine deaminase [Phlegmacium glaucopus]|nr:guanine deaminase [Phlegmacium glaucopus]
MALRCTAYIGAIINPQERNPKEPISYNAWPTSILVVSENGEIVRFFRLFPDFDIKGTLEKEGFPDCDVVDVPPGSFLMPGFIDTHTHAPQFPNLGTGHDYQLLEWLREVTYPREAKFVKNEYAQDVYPLVVRRIIDFGTTTCCYYGTIHLEATKTLVHVVRDSGQRAVIGKCNMDREVPDDNKECTPDSIAATEALIQYIQCLPQTTGPSLIHPAITPRFAISCTPELLRGLGDIAASDPSLRIQTHISENMDDIAKMGELFPGNTSYADVYDSFGLIGPTTILAHAVYLGDDEVKLIADKKAGISHCPTSNFNLSSGVAPIGKYLDAGIKVGLGTDVSGGFDPSILTTIQNASIASTVIALQSNPGPNELRKPGYGGRKLSVATLLYLATLGGAHVCGLNEMIGSFEVGKSFDALLVNMSAEVDNPGFWPDDEAKKEKALRGSLERFLFCGDDRNISKVFVQGKLIGGKNCPQ